MDIRNTIAKRVAQEFNDGDFVNLGIGIPTLSTNFIPEGVNVILNSENGFLGMGPQQEFDKDLINASAVPASIKPGGSFFDLATSFGVIRGGHLNTSVLGALQVDEEGNIASWIVPGKAVHGMGGAMDLVVGAKRVIVAMEHTAKGSPKIVKKCTYPLTAVSVVDMIITELAVFIFENGRLTLTEMASGVTLEEIKAVTEANFEVSKNLKIF